ncbi:MAG: DsbA family protein [Candidatus Niyogibacteria bacterium]|nr:DsbA family protein [Candidatus Niyogibacteria bacterium]
MKNWMWAVVILGASVLGFLVLIVMSSGSSPARFDETSARRAGGGPALVFDAAEWLRGATTSTVTLAEYSDFQCPACGAWEPQLQEIVRDYGERIRFIYRHFPLPQHAQAELAAYASEAAGLQGKFWEMHDVIFERQRDWADNRNARDIFMDAARTLGLDMAKFANDLDSDTVRSEVDKDKKSGLAAQVNATPTFFVNSVKVEPRSSAELRAFLDDALAP